jgi:hypothetical protein
MKADTSVLKSNLEKNPELKQVLLEETPWVLDAAMKQQQNEEYCVVVSM